MNTYRDPDPTGTANGGGTSWLATLPPEIRGEPSLGKYQDIAALAKGHVELNRLVGVNRLPAPQENWKEEQWNGLYKALGRPDDLNEYPVPKVELPEGVAPPEERIKEAKTVFHKLGLNKRQAEDLTKWYFETLGKDYQQITEKTAQEIALGEQTLKKEWGDKYNNNLAITKAALKRFGSDNLTNILEQTGVGNHPEMLKFFFGIGQAMLEDTAMKAGSSQFTDQQTQAREEIARLRADANFQKAYNDGMDPQHKAVMARLASLYEIAYPTGQP